MPGHNVQSVRRGVRSMQLSWRCYETFVQPLKEGVVMKRMKVLLPIFVVVFALLLTACGGSSQSGSSSPSPTLTPAPTTDPTSKPTAKPATATGNLTATYGTPRLGGPVSDFIGKYGNLIPAVRPVQRGSTTSSASRERRLTTFQPCSLMRMDM